MTPTPDNKALLIQRMQNHIHAVMTHFGTTSRSGTWSTSRSIESQPDGYRRSPWFNIIGPQYIAIALQAARAANPTAKLYINDFNTTDPAKRDFLVALVREPQEPRRAARRRRPPDAQQHRVPVAAVGDRRRQPVRHDGRRAGRSPRWTSASTAGRSRRRSPATPTSRQSRHIAGRLQLPRLRPGPEAAAGKIVSITIWGTSRRQVVADVVDQGRRAAAVRPVAEEEVRLLGVRRSAAAAGRRPVDRDDRRADRRSPAGQAIAYTITVTNNADTNDQAFEPTDDDLPAANVVALHGGPRAHACSSR